KARSKENAKIKQAERQKAYELPQEDATASKPVQKRSRQEDVQSMVENLKKRKVNSQMKIYWCPAFLIVAASRRHRQESGNRRQPKTSCHRALSRSRRRRNRRRRQRRNFAE